MIYNKKIPIFIVTFLLFSIYSVDTIFAFSSKIQNAYDFAYKNNITNMESLDLFDPNRTMSRQEFAKMIYNTQSAIVPEEVHNILPCDILFGDSSVFDTTLADFIEKVCAKGIMRGSHNFFHPHDSLLRSEALAALVRAISPSQTRPKDSTSGQWWLVYQRYAEEHGIVFQDTDFQKPILRGEFIEWAYTLSKNKSIKLPEILYMYHKDFANLYREYKNNRFMESIVSEVIQTIHIPDGLSFKYDSCDDENAFYSPENHTITLCYELIDFYKKQIADNPDSFGTGALEDLLTETLYHEFGHAIIDMYDLPITGKEEDVADQIAAFLLIGERDDASIHAANLYYINAINDTSNKDDLPYWDEHSLDLQRYYNIMCWVYGSDTEYYSDFVTGGILPSDRAELCESEYQKMNDSLIRILGNKINF